MTQKADLIAVALRSCMDRELPARIPAEDVTKLLGLTLDDVTFLMGCGLLKPLGKPAQNAPKWFSAVEIVMLAGDRDWLSDATRKLSEYWRRKHARESISNTGHLSGVTRRQRTKPASPDSPPKSSPDGQWTGGEQAPGGQ